MADESNKTEQPTGKRIDEMRGKGQFPKAQEINIVFTLAAVFTIFVFSGKEKGMQIYMYARNIFSSLADIQITEESALVIFSDMVLFTGEIILPLLFWCTLAAILAGGLQSHFHMSNDRLGIKFENINIVKGFQKLFSFSKFVQVGIDMLKVLAIGLIIYGALVQIRHDPIFYTPVPVGHVGEFLLKILLMMLVRLIGAIGVIAAIHYIYHFNKHKKESMMTREEVREEHKASQGDPKIKMAQRKLALRLIQKQMLHEIPVSDVVVTNPTHYAVALKYERGKDKAPIIVAKGENRLALLIKRIAKENNVPIVENKVVARVLYRMGQVGLPVPSELYEVVANILSFVYRTYKSYFYYLKFRREEQANQR
ncbi:MAG: hypothetical protein A2Y14_02025 [Verrucomicrobia bacterium GWF2_51_19]|nr:MAG: hypothetical protein A2Y14_02025 [Verrucomicrobia bacterium GWF2_51_19]HCJ12054.1 type III secretion protein [Opitutae bacterium]